MLRKSSPQETKDITMTAKLIMEFKQALGKEDLRAEKVLLGFTIILVTNGLCNLAAYYEKDIRNTATKFKKHLYDLWQKIPEEKTLKSCPNPSYSICHR